MCVWEHVCYWIVALNIDSYHGHNHNTTDATSTPLVEHHHLVHVGEHVQTVGCY